MIYSLIDGFIYIDTFEALRQNIPQTEKFSGFCRFFYDVSSEDNFMCNFLFYQFIYSMLINIYVCIYTYI